ncbi:hypothetical protein OBV_13730 [Oscillibacter valericigenes Sjm18-20]|nr:hypothetical protein OBV_13730 [Oscillibacter valericigenes Sjm18-20]
MRVRKENWVLTMAVVLVLALSACGDSGGDSSSASGSDGEYVEGRIGDVMHDRFFDFTVNSAYTCGSLEEYTPEAGKQLLVVELTIKNTFNETIPMFDTDFQARWNEQDDPDNAFANPVETVVSEDQLEAEYDLAVDEERTGLLIFEIPEDHQDYSIVYLEELDNGTTGDLYQVYFTAKNSGTSV